MSNRKFNRLRAAIDQRNYHWLDDTEPVIANALRAEVEDGATPDEIEGFARELSGEQDWFVGKLKSAARHIEASVSAQRG